MYLWAFLISIAYIPGWTGMSIPTGWAFLSATLVIATWRRTEVTVLHLLGLIFLIYVAAFTTDDLFPLWQLAIFGGAFLFGTQLDEYRSLALGLTLGLSVSLGFSLAQLLGYEPLILPWPGGHAGLFYNPNVLAQVSALLLIWLCIEQEFYLLPLPVAGLIVGQSRGAYIALAVVAVFALAQRSWRALYILLPASLGLWFLLLPRDTLRFFTWEQMLLHLRPLGWGPGVSAMIDDQWMEYAHNEYIDLAFQYGLGAIPACALWLLLLANRRGHLWPVWLAFSCLALYSYPLHTPVVAFIGAIAAGSVARGWPLACDLLGDRRLDLIPRSGNA